MNNAADAAANNLGPCCDCDDEKDESVSIELEFNCHGYLLKASLVGFDLERFRIEQAKYAGSSSEFSEEEDQRQQPQQQRFNSRAASRDKRELRINASMILSRKQKQKSRVS